MQRGLSEEKLKLDEMEQALALMSGLETLVLGIIHVSLSGLDD